MRVQSLVKQLPAMEWIIVIYALLNAALYASVLPLWRSSRLWQSRYGRGG
jgi:ABC-type lipoprotein release transport system permease subunit